MIKMRRLDVIVDDEITETFLGDDLQVELIEEESIGPILKIKKGFVCVGMFAEWRYWKFFEVEELNEK